jgi:thiol-disulfide isomerase/thioredoxin
MRIAQPLLLVTLMAALGGSLSDSRAQDDAAAPEVPTLPVERGGQDVMGEIMPELEFERWVDRPVSETGAAGETEARVTLYRWWTDGCPHCEKSLPALERLRRLYEPQGLRVVAVYHPKPPRDVADEDIRSAARGAGYEGAIALDRDWSELEKFYLSVADRDATSASFLVDRSRVIRFVHPGPEFYPSDEPGSARANADYRLIERAIRVLLRIPGAP